jgi:hypothetical protein
MSTAKKRELGLEHGRSLAVQAGEDGETVEIRGDGGVVELRIRMTPAGPVVQLSGASVEISAAETIRMQCKEFSVEAAERLELGTKGDLKVTVEGKTHLESTDDTVIRGKMIWLN